MRFNNRGDPPQLMPGEPIVARELNRAKPELGFLSTLCDMDMGRLITFMRIKMKAVTVQSKNRWHDRDSCAHGLIAVNPAIPLNNSLPRRAFGR
jgi:hypothetical protein